MRKPSGASAPERQALLVAPEAPYPPVGGGPLRTASLVEYLARRYVLDVIAFREPGAPDPRGLFPSGTVRAVHVIDLPFHSARPAARIARNLARFLRGRAPLNDRFGGFGAAVERALADRRYDLALVEHFWCAPYHAQIARHAARTVLDLHNIESVYYARMGAAARGPARVAFRRYAAAARVLERRWIPRFTSVLVASEPDREVAAQIAPGARVCVYPNAIPFVSQPDVPEQDAVVFSGNLGYPPNIDAVRFFRRDVWPRLRDSRPGLRWRILGKNPQGVARFVEGDPRIELTGAVTNAVEELARARVAVVPVLAGSGTRMKILEAWAAGRAVVSTPLGAEGLPARSGEHLILAPADGSFAPAILRLFDDPAERNRIGAAGRALYTERFTWERAWDILAGFDL
ncbi:MAG TPA: glycosyltransferase family 4 protein [Bryobacteraceae bacterium]|nr:glycosyltransferase family 4 protein [Bryobacteraceae bacterium]